MRLPARVINVERTKLAVLPLTAPMVAIAGLILSLASSALVPSAGNIVELMLSLPASIGGTSPAGGYRERGGRGDGAFYHGVAG